ncbi:hypothetical protein MY3296_001938 [Beauveria thailandica]
MTDWAKLKVVDLKAELKRRDLPQHGLKAELVARLEEATAPVADEAPIDAVDAEPAPPAEEAVPETETPAPAPAPSPAPETTADKSETREASVPVEASEEPADAAAETQPGNAEQQSLPAAVDAPSDASQKRKRKSATPSPDGEEVAIKRARALSEQGEEQQRDDVASAPASEGTGAPADRSGSPMAVEQTPPTASNKAAEHQQPLASPPPTQLPETIAPAVSDNDNDNKNYDKMDVDEDPSVAPAVHPATTALYISNLMRPLRPADIQAHVCELAAGAAVSSYSNSQATPTDGGGGGVIVQFHLDQIRTHAFVILSSVQAAARVRSKLHDRVWPNESNRKALCVDFVPAEKIDDWIAMEQDGGGGGGGGRPGRSTARWEVIYTTGPDGVVEAHLQQAGGGPASSRGGPPRLPSFSQASATDTAGFRGDRDHNRDRDRERGGGGDLGSPRGSRRDGPNPRQERAIPPPPSELDYELQRTRARPSIRFQLVAQALAERRIDNMRSFYTKDTRRVLGREINRYSFEEGDGFVDRGKEVFEGIRPPHRERGGGGGGGGGRRGGGKFGGRGGGGGGGSRGRRNGGGDRPRSDRYLPGSSFGGGGGRRWDNNDRSGDRRY